LKGQDTSAHRVRAKAKIVGRKTDFKRSLLDKFGHQSMVDLCKERL